MGSGRGRLRLGGRCASLRGGRRNLRGGAVRRERHLLPCSGNMGTTVMPVFLPLLVRTSYTLLFSWATRVSSTETLCSNARKR